LYKYQFSIIKDVTFYDGGLYVYITTLYANYITNSIMYNAIKLFTARERDIYVIMLFAIYIVQ